MDDGCNLLFDFRGRARARLGCGAGLPRLAALLRILDSSGVRRRTATGFRRRAVQPHADVDGVPEPAARRHGGLSHSRDARVGVAASSPHAADLLADRGGVSAGRFSRLARRRRGAAGTRGVDRDAAHVARARHRLAAALRHCLCVLCRSGFGAQQPRFGDGRSSGHSGRSSR